MRLTQHFSNSLYFACRSGNATQRYAPVRLASIQTRAQRSSALTACNSDRDSSQPATLRSLSDGTCAAAPEADDVLAIAPPALKRLRRHVLGHVQVRGRRLQVLPEGQDVDACAQAHALPFSRSSAWQCRRRHRESVASPRPATLQCICHMRHHTSYKRRAGSAPGGWAPPAVHLSHARHAPYKQKADNAPGG